MYASLMQAPAAIAITRGTQHVFDLVNHRYRELLGTAEVIGVPAKQVLDGLVSEHLVAALDVVFRTGEPFVGDEISVFPEGSPRRGEDRFVDVVVQPMRDAEGAIDGLMIHSVEVTARVRARQKEREAVMVREEFLSVASHELRTPLTTLTLQLQAVLRSAVGLPPKVERALEAALRQTRRLDRLATDLLDVSHTTTGTMSLESECFDLAELASEVIERHAAEARGAGSEVSLDATTVVGCWDRLRLDQAATNLLMNAVKYGSGRPVAVSVDSDDDAARLTVRDQGIGISARDQERIFGRFERAAPATHYGGLGLGLYIARKIVRAHGGDIHVESKEGSGSTFTILLPLNGRDRMR